MGMRPASRMNERGPWRPWVKFVLLSAWLLVLMMIAIVMVHW